MKKAILIMTAAAALSGCLSLSAGKPVPFRSDFYIDHNLDEGWQMKNNVRRGGIPWSPADLTSDLLDMGAKGAACKTYNSDQTNTADTWLISPAVDVTAGVNYTVSIYARTTANYGETECFKITAATSGELTDLKAGTVILDKPNYSNLGAYEELTATFTPETSGEVYFGVQCYSEPDMDHLYLTQFSVTDGTQGGGDVDPVTPVDGKQLPYSFDFSDETTFSTDWISVAGPEAVSSSVWTYATMGYANWDFTEGQKEDNWLISPGLAVTKAGSYAIDTKVWANGKVELLLGTDPADLATFSLVNTFENNSLPGDEDRPDRMNVNIETPGTYYLAFRACSTEGTYMGHRVYYAGMKENVVTPAIVTDLTATADLSDELLVNLSWTYPALTNTGAELTEIVKAVVYRGDVEVETFNYPTPGSPWACTDSKITEPGVYSYSIVIYGENGCDTDNSPMVVSAGYVGKPTLEFPCDVNLTNDKETAKMFTVVDHNADGNTWVYDSEAWNPAFVSTNPGEAEMDDYVCTPYLHLLPGYYLANFKVGGTNNTYELGYVTSRHQQAETFVKLAEIADDEYSSASDHKIVAVIQEEGDYCFAVRHIGMPTDPTGYYKSVTFNGFSLAAQTILPEVATDLKATAAPDNSLSAVIEWTNPSLDNGGQPLESLTKAVIYRDGEEITTVTEGLIPGESSSYEDKAITTPGEHTYKVEVYNDNGCSETAAPEVTVFVGPGLELPYYTESFSDWKILNLDDDWYEWELDWNNVFGFTKSWGDNPDDYALSPFIELANNHKYQLTVTTKAAGSMEVDLVVGTSYDLASLSVVGKIAAGDVEAEHVFDFCVNPMDEPATTAEGETTPYPLTVGKNTFGFHATTLGTFQLKSFHLVDNGSMSGVSTTIAAGVAGLSYSEGIVKTSAPATISVYALDGRCLMTRSDVTILDITTLSKGQTVIISANIAGDVKTLKVIL